MLENIRKKIPIANSWLFVSIFFFLPTHVAPAYIITCLILLLLLIEGDYRKKWVLLKSSPIFWIFQTFFWIFPLSLLWTEDLDTGIRMVRSYAFFLLSPVYILVARRELIGRCISSFLAGCILSEILAYYNWVQAHYLTEWPRGIRVRKTPEDTAPFVDRLMYAPILAWAGYLAAHKAITSSGARRIGYSILTLTTLGNLIFSGGRTGQVAFLILLILLVFQNLSKRPLFATLLSITLTSTIVAGSYSISDHMKERVDLAIHEATHYNESVNTSVGLRINFYINSIRIFKDNMLLGVGIGDFAKEYEIVNKKFTPAWSKTTNPHNQYFYVITTTGLLGGAALLLTQLAPIIRSHKKIQKDNLSIALILLISIICIFESYLWRSNTSLLYVIFATQFSRHSQQSKIIN